MMHTKLLPHRILIGYLMVIGFVLTAWPGWAQNDETEKPERLITMAVEYPGVELPSPGG